MDKVKQGCINSIDFVNKVSLSFMHASPHTCSHSYLLERSYRFIQNSHIKAKNRNPHLFFIFEFISLNVESFTVELVSYTRVREFLLSLLLDNTNLGGI